MSLDKQGASGIMPSHCWMRMTPSLETYPHKRRSAVSQSHQRICPMKTRGNQNRRQRIPEVGEPAQERGKEEPWENETMVMYAARGHRARVRTDTRETGVLQATARASAATTLSFGGSESPGDRGLDNSLVFSLCGSCTDEIPTVPPLPGSAQDLHIPSHGGSLL